MLAVLPFLVWVGAQSPVTIKSLLAEMTDLNRLARRPQPIYRAAQASSYERSRDPFANGDAGQFVRSEGKEDVMADLEGPGSVVRIWSANPQGTLRFYFDGRPTPDLTVNMKDLLEGRILPFVPPFAYVGGQGTNLYFPIPYATHLKITVEGSRGLYYHVGYRTYAPGTAVQTYRSEDIPGLAETSRTIEPEPSAIGEMRAKRLKPASEVTWSAPDGAHVVTQLAFRLPVPDSRTKLPWGDPGQLHNILRNLLLEATFDGETTVRAPLGDFFIAVPGLNPYRSLPMEVRSDGTLLTRFPMPYRKTATFRVRNTGRVPVTLAAEVKAVVSPWTSDTYLFHAQWGSQSGPTEPKMDMHFLDVRGEGTFVGVNMHIANPSLAWWGEGDEKFYVDGERLPSTFGTGTEDYFGYAWGSSQLFNRPYHGQVRCDGPANYGHTSDYRFHLFDPIPFRQSLKFDMERWHWQNINATYDRTVYWYAAPGSTPPTAIDTRQLALPELGGPASLPGVIEGEALPIVTKTGGKTEVQSFWDLSGGKQLWWRDARPADRLELKVRAPQRGRYRVSMNLCHARDYGIHRLTLNGHVLDTLDFYQPELAWKHHELGVVELQKGDNVLTVECVGRNAASDPAFLFGMDYIKLVR